MYLYHGTTLDAWKNIQKYDIDVFINKNRELDFGYGFYLGEQEYAERVAFEKAAIGNEEEDSSIPVLMQFNIDVDEIVKNTNNADCKRIVVFHKKSISFAKCVFQNRYYCGKDMLSADFIMAPLADGRVDDVVGYYKERESFFRKLYCYYHFLKPQYSGMKQYVFKKPGLCTCKNLVTVINLSEGRIIYEQGDANL